MVGETIGHYRVLDKIGEGGMGVVYRAEDTLLRRTVALKFLSEAALTNEKHRARFLREAQAAGSLDHPNICTIHSVEEHGMGLFIVMTFLPGETLYHRVKRGPLPLAGALDVAMQIGRGLQEAHGRGVVHRDVKSANIMLTPDGKAVITDFGLALLAERSRITDAGTTLGTVAYMSPEQALAADVDHRTDIWSLGVVLYEMVTGLCPFRGETAHAICRSILTQAPLPITEVRKRTPRDFGWVVERALAKNREERYAHMEEFLEVLGSVRRKLPSKDSEGLAGTPSSPPQDTDAPTVTLHDGYAITIETEVREKVKDSARPSGPEATSRFGAVAAKWWKSALLVLAAVVVVGMILIWVREV